MDRGRWAVSRVLEGGSSDERRKGGAMNFPPSSTQATGSDDDRSREPKFGLFVSLQRSDLLWCLLYKETTPAMDPILNWTEFSVLSELFKDGFLVFMSKK
ncbi:hypothetical protein MRB53_027054 [Persea americana]|uniref:Uncharacterized protein n=1 Tax=Persea americana TaxID=3435 RepID=A0ACC2LKM9_PERAE|nr:hypothetical protein MRB53_027054 [Persea americana]